MRLLKNRSFQSYIFLFIFLLLIEICFRLISSLELFDLSFLRVFILINIISIVIGYIASLLPKIINKTIIVLILLISSVYSFLQMGFYNFLGVYISLNTSSQLGAVTSYIKDFLHSIKPICYLIFIPFLLSIISYFIIRIISNKKETNNSKFMKKYYYEKSIIGTSFMIALILFSYAFYITLDDKYLTNSYQAISNKELFKTVSNPGLCVKEFGVLSFGLLDLKSKAYNEEDIDLTYYAYHEKEKTDESRVIDDTTWNNLINTETNEVYNNLNNYFINQDITDKNEFTSLFEGKNLIIIMMESVNDLIVDEKYFPNFYKLKNEGWYFNNNYSPRNSCATGNNEFSALTSLYSIYNNCTSNTYLYNTYYESLFNLFNNKNYLTNSFHNYTEAYYYREIIHPNMGSSKYYGVESLNIDFYPYYGGWSSDVDLMNAYLNVLDESNLDNGFMSYITTVTSHQPYSATSPYGDLYLSKFEDTSYSEELKRYFSKLTVLDESLGVLVNGLEERNLLNDTVIVLFGDHYPYGLANEVINEKLTRSLDNYENEKVPLVIYNPELKKEEYNTYTSYINLTPTLANLFNLDYDPRLYTGHDIFSDDYNNIVVYADSSWKNDKAFYDVSTGKITYYTDFTYTNDEIKRINEVIYAKMNASAIAVKHNYFEYLGNNLNERKDV